MTRQDFEKAIEEIADETFKRLSGNNSTTPTDGGIIFPKYRNNKVRVSEQEMRFAFVEELRRLYPEWCYSIETPTIRKYNFQGEEPKVIENGQKGGRSAQFDLTIYKDKEGKEVLAHIEFKAKNPSPRKYKKDFLKLSEETTYPNTARVFIHLLESCDDDTVKNLRDEKLKDCKKENVKYLCYSLNEHTVTDPPQEDKHKIKF